MKKRKQSLSFRNKKITLLLLSVGIFAGLSAFGYGIYKNKDLSNTDVKSSAASNPLADLNADNNVNIQDLSILISKWATNSQPADINKDGVVNVQDLSILISSWGVISNPGGWILGWSDEFSGSTVDTSQWGVYDPSNNKGRYGDGDPGFLPCLSKDNAIVGSGALTIQSKKEQMACNKGITTDYTSAFIGSRDANKYYPLYGRYEMRAKIPHGQGIWPAFWLRHVNGSSAAEVDIVELFHNSNPGSVTQTLHFPNSIGSNIAKKGVPFETAVKGSGGWHNFAVDIEQVYSGRDDTVKFTFWVDNLKTLEYTNTNATSWAGIADKTRAWDIALNTAIGGEWVGNPDSNLGWGAANGGVCLLERPQRATANPATCSKERTAGKWYSDAMPSAPSQDGIDDIWLAPWNYNGQTSADYIVDYVRYYSK
ncbi:family 16 glycosylhydrolase [Candidatus Saccharibacteria bacterium]|nr:family 16 glycosylhydrolase [Candidatus Saccharibacteria bacterium]